MNVLLLGDEHSCGYGLPGRQLSYAGHFIKHLCRTGRSVTVDAYAHLTVWETAALLARLPLSRYDLIVLQLGPDLMARKYLGAGLSHNGMATRPSILKGPGLSRNLGRTVQLHRIKQTVRTLADIALSVMPGLGGPRGLTKLLAMLRPFRHNVLLMSPFPRRTLLGQWSSLRARSVLRRREISQTFSVFDTQAIVEPRDEYFLTGDPDHLNAVSHELLGRALFDFYQSAPTIVTVQTTNRN
ncbi:SGNH/GDSL hydrolase family protein [Spirosoma utsteinense]|uniref:SGNH/GDSL hydrolase family protein n=1 Tax=Spirosoma utsteinense TaxID=2585773 RepID=A0ABR6VZR7_9BACT|nr:SGNH/GDSL hydrolase family protein [Spirosoma utsteinense]MBC3784615.1 hypothetical protein [Spirosoma utsteinense]MBC3789632.1 hypothetical protein [Spirosoma utsteinense]